MSSITPPLSLDRRSFLRHAAMLGGLAALGWRVAHGQPPGESSRYGPLVDKGDLWLPQDFHYQIISWQGKPMSDGGLTPGAFDGMGVFSTRPGPRGARRAILIRNHENRDNPGFETRVEAGADFEYDPLTFGGNTKLVVERRVTGRRDPFSRLPLYEYEVIEDFAILGGTSTNCAGGELPFKKWVTCEEVVKRSANGIKHGYIFEIDATAAGPVRAVPVPGAGRFSHEAVAWCRNVLYLTEDRGISFDPVLGAIGACFYRYLPQVRQTRRTQLAQSGGTLQVLRLRDETHASMNTGRAVGVPHPVEWVTIDEPDHDDDSDFRADRAPGFTPVRIQAQDKGAAFFNRLEGAWTYSVGRRAKIYFDATSGGAAGLGQVWEYDALRATLTLLYESTSAQTLTQPDNLVVLPITGDILLCEDSGGEMYVRGLTPAGELYNFAKVATNYTEFCGACFDRASQTLFLNQQGAGGNLPDGPPGARAVTYAIYGPFSGPPRWRRYGTCG